MRERSDFVHVRLTAEGRKFAGEGETLRVITARMHYVFTGDDVVEVMRAGEWPALRNEHTPDGKAMFGLVAETAATEAEEN